MEGTSTLFYSVVPKHNNKKKEIFLKTYKYRFHWYMPDSQSLWTASLRKQVVSMQYFLTFWLADAYATESMSLIAFLNFNLNTTIIHEI